MRLQNRRLVFQMIIAFIVTGVATGLVLRTTWQDESWTAIARFDIGYVGLAFGLLIVTWIVDGLRMGAMTRALGYKVAPLLILRTNFLGYFLSAVTPFTAGGGALQVYSLARAGLSVGHGTAAVLVGGFIAQLMLAVTGIVVVFAFNIPVTADPGFQQIIRVGVLLYAFVVISLVTLAWHIDKGRKLVEAIVKGLLRFIVDGEKVVRWAAIVDKTIVDIHRGLHEMVQRRSLWTIAAGVTCCVQYALQFTIIPVLAFGLGLDVSVPLLIAIQVPVYLLASVLPTPGGSGGLELGVASALIQHLPPAQVGIVVAVWRLLTFYVVLAAGGFISLHFIRSELARAAFEREEKAARHEAAPLKKGPTEQRNETAQRESIEVNRGVEKRPGSRIVVPAPRAQVVVPDSVKRSISRQRHNLDRY